MSADPRHITIAVRPNPDEDDCLSASAGLRGSLLLMSDVWACARASSGALIPTPARQAEREAQELALREARRKAELDRIEAAPCQGALCRVVKGRKVPKGLVGECFWIGESAYGTRVGLKDEHGTVHWTAASNVERIRDHECPWKHPDCAEDDELRACCARDFMRAIARHAAA